MKSKIKFPKIFLALAILSMLFLLFGCADKAAQTQSAGDEAENGKTENAVGPLEEKTEEQSPVPKDVNFNGEEMRILNCSYYTEDASDVRVESEIGEIVNDSIYRRNSKTQNDLNLKFTFIDRSLTDGFNFNQAIQNSAKAGSDDYDLLIDAQYDCVPLATSNVLMNLTDLPYVDLSRPWWPGEYIKEMTIGEDRIYFLTGDISLTFIRQMSCVYFNKKLYTDNFGDSDDMYKMVLEGKWTLDKLSDMAKGMYKDLNGNGEYDDGDQYACGLLAANLTDHFMLDAGIRITARDSDDLPYFVMNNEKTVNFTEKLYQLYYNNEGSRIFPPTNESNNIAIPQKFMRDELLFDFGWFYISELLRNMQTDYGIIPFPKYDESQASYLSLAHDIVPIYCIPITCEKMEAAGAVLEAMAFESYKSVLPSYFEVALKLKYARDSSEDAFKIIDMIHDNNTTDFAYIYTFALESIGHIMREITGAKTADFVSRYEKKEPRAQKGLEKIIDAYINN
ncbi:MAG: hypothetical protein FWG34_01340 [Oscillospiraceae bacterium]|nr:hypothetical protein [Oscillospiraceae bacterium]